jgi:hypothetical protein
MTNSLLLLCVVTQELIRAKLWNIHSKARKMRKSRIQQAIIARGWLGVDAVGTKQSHECGV